MVCAHQISASNLRAPLTRKMKSMNANAQLPRRSMLKKGKLEIPNDMGVGTMAWGDEKVGFVSDPKYKPKDGEFNPADLQVCGCARTHACRCISKYTKCCRCDLQRQRVHRLHTTRPWVTGNLPFPTTFPLTCLSFDVCSCNRERTTP